MRVLVLLVAVLGCTLVGCGYDPDSSVYDATGNPENFPDRAVKLVDDIQTGRLTDYDSVMAVFGGLYTSHAELLDDIRWTRVIERLGVKFRMIAERCADAGLQEYDRAAKFYKLASLARPRDDRLQYLSALYAVWEEALTDSMISPVFNPDSSQLELPRRISLLKYFLLGDTLHQRFAQDHLLPELLGSLSLEESMSASATHNFSAADKAFVVSQGITHEPIHEKLASFTEPAIDLVAAQIVPHPGGWYAAELYFMPIDSLTANYTVALRFASADTATAPSVDNHLLTFDFHPPNPTSTWHVGRIAAVYRRLVYHGLPTEVSVGLYATRSDSVQFVRVRDSGEPLLTLPSSTFRVR